MTMSIKCKACRCIILNNTECSATLLDAHSQRLENQPTVTCSTITDNKLLFLDDEQLPQWILSRIVTEDWSKGKLNCFQCNARIGAFDFVSGTKCQCMDYVVPAVHIINSKVDFTRITQG